MARLLYLGQVGQGLSLNLKLTCVVSELLQFFQKLLLLDILAFLLHCVKSVTELANSRETTQQGFMRIRLTQVPLVLQDLFLTEELIRIDKLSCRQRVRDRLLAILCLFLDPWLKGVFRQVLIVVFFDHEEP